MAFIQDLMNTRLAIAGPKESVRQVSCQMDQHGVGKVLVVDASGGDAKGFRHLPVVRDGKPIRILSARDFQQVVIGGLESFIDEARDRKALHEGQDPDDHLGGSYGQS